MIWLLIELDIPQLSSDGIQKLSFGCTYSLQSSSIHSLISSSFDGKTVDNNTESIVIPDKSLNKPESIILPSFLHSLKHIVIGDNCFEGVRLFELDGLSELEIIIIGKKSFRIIGSERTDGTCRIVNCAKLKSIQIGEWSFDDYHSVELNNLPSLQSIDIGERCFYRAPSFSLTGLIDWLV